MEMRILGRLSLSLLSLFQLFLEAQVYSGPSFERDRFPSLERERLLSLRARRSSLSLRGSRVLSCSSSWTSSQWYRGSISVLFSSSPSLSTWRCWFGLSFDFLYP